MEERHPLALAGSAVRDAAASFLTRHGDQTQVIRLPEGDFMLRAGNEIWSSLTPGSAPRVINLGPGRDFFKHDNYIISTVGLDPATGELAYPNNNMGVAFSNQWGMTVPPLDFQIRNAAHVVMNHHSKPEHLDWWRDRQPEGLNWGHVEDMEAAGIRNFDGQNPLLLSRVLEDVGDKKWHWLADGRRRFGGWGFMGSSRTDIAKTLASNTPGLAVPSKFDATFQDLKKAGVFFRIPDERSPHLEAILSGPTLIPGLTPSGVVQAMMPDHTKRMNAYLGGSQIVPHPSWLIPDFADYNEELLVIPHRNGDGAHTGILGEFVTAWPRTPGHREDGSEKIRASFHMNSDMMDEGYVWRSEAQRREEADFPRYDHWTRIGQ